MTDKILFQGMKVVQGTLDKDTLTESSQIISK